MATDQEAVRHNQARTEYLLAGRTYAYQVWPLHTSLQYVLESLLIGLISLGPGST